LAIALETRLAEQE